MEKSLLLLSAPLITLLVHADEPLQKVQPIAEESAIIEPREENRELFTIVPPSVSDVAQGEAQPSPNDVPPFEFEEFTEVVEEQDNTPEVTPPLETHMMKTPEDRLASIECQIKQLQDQICECCQPFPFNSSFYVKGEWLYWKFTEGGTEYAINNVAAVPSDNTPDIPGGHVDKVEFDWQSGFRVGAGYHFEEKGWDLFLRYSQVKPDGHSHKSGILFPLLNYQDSFPVVAVTSADAKWNIDYKVLDFELGRRFLIDPTLSFRPYFGLKAARINQHFQVAYGNNDVRFVGVIPIGQSNLVKEKNDFEGIGLSAGLATLWEMSECYGFSLYGRATASLLVSEIKTKQTQDLWGPPLSGEVPTPTVLDQDIDLRSTFHRLLPVVDLAFGLEWARGFCCDQYRIQFHAGIEGQYWWRQNYLERFTGTTAAPEVYLRPTEDLGIYGLNVGARFDF